MLNLFRINIISNKLHRWAIFHNGKYLNCSERIERCHSMNFEDYSFTKVKYVEEPKIVEEDKKDYFDGEDISEYMLTIG